MEERENIGRSVVVSVLEKNDITQAVLEQAIVDSWSLDSVLEWSWTCSWSTAREKEIERD